MADNKLDIIVATIKDGNATRESVIKAAGCTPKAFASYLTSLRNGAKYGGSAICPIEATEGDAKIFRLGTYEEYEASRVTAEKVSAEEKPLAERHATAVKNINKANATLNRFTARKEAGETFEKGSVDDLKFQIAKLQVTLANVVYSELPALPVVDESAEAVDTTEDTELI